jgi:hypothetical protein
VLLTAPLAALLAVAATTQQPQEEPAFGGRKKRQHLEVRESRQSGVPCIENFSFVNTTRML